MSDIQSKISSLFDRFSEIAGDVFSEISTDVVRSFMHYSMPYDFEYYLTALELIDDNGRSIMYFQFPLNPSDMSISEPGGHEVSRTMSSVVVSDMDVWNPSSIEMSGSFGREMKILAMNKNGRMSVGEVGLMVSKSIVPTDMPSSFRIRKWSSLLGQNLLVKTGYGAIKMMQTIISGDKIIDKNTGNPYKLILHSHMSGDSYWVKVRDFSMTQSTSTNTVWNYRLVLDGVCPLEYVVGNKSREISNSSLSLGVINKAINMVGSRVYNSVYPNRAISRRTR